MTNKTIIQENLIKEVFWEVEKLNSQFSQGKIVITDLKQAQEIVWKIYYNIWQNNVQYNSTFTLDELKKLHQNYNQKILNKNRKTQIK